MIKDLLQASLAALFIMPSGIFVHELGHYLVAVIFQWAADMYPTYVDLPGPIDTTSFPYLLFVTAGPIVDSVLIVSGILILRSQIRPERGGLGLTYWIGFVLSVIAMKWVFAPLFAIVMRSDEEQISEFFGLHGMVVPVLFAIIGLLATIWILRNHFIQKNPLVPFYAY